MEDVVATSAANIEAAAVRTVADVRRQPRPLIAYSPERLAANAGLRRFLYENLYYHPGRGRSERPGVRLPGRRVRRVPARAGAVGIGVGRAD